MKRALNIAALVVGLVSLAVAADFWNAKPYTKWSQADTVRLLTDSPWAKTTSLRAGSPVAAMRSRGGTAATQETQEQPTVRYAVTLRSALPVRQANVRLTAIEKKYEKLGAAEKQQLDDAWKKYIDADYSDVIVFTVAYQSNDPAIDRQLVTYFLAQTLDTMKPTTALLLADDQKLQPIAFTTVPHEVQIAFARPPALNATSFFSLEFQHPDVTGQTSRRITSRFQLKEMSFGGALAY